MIVHSEREREGRVCVIGGAINLPLNERRDGVNKAGEWSGSVLVDE